MGVEVRVEMQTDILRAIADSVSDPGFRDLAARALNDTVADAERQTATLLGPFMPGLRPSDITAALSTTPARPEHLSASLVGGGKALPMIRFQPRASRAEGVTITIAGKTERYRHAFLATVKHGHEGVFERKGRERLPIRELYGPSVHGMMARTDVLPRITAELESDLLANLARQLDRAVRRAGGHPAGA
jgi:hypothetical protein